MYINNIKNGVAAEIKDFKISEFSVDEASKVKETLHNNLIVVLKKQPTEPAYFTNFVKHIGPIANFTQFFWDPITGKQEYDPRNAKTMIDPTTWPDPSSYPVQRVTGKKVDGNYSGIFGTGILDWHANLNGLTRADGVALQGYKDCEGTSTTWLNTAKVLEEMPADLLDRCKNVYCEYQYSPEVWASGLPKEQKKYMLKNKSKYAMWLIQKNICGKKGIYFYTNNDCKICTKDATLYEDLKDFTFQEKFMYQHYYEIGDIVLSDQLLSLHKRDQNDPDILSKRILHRITFRISNAKDPEWIAKQNEIQGVDK
jgi:alpha-ketoglutarate-dependent taurine dioxygenase